MRYEINREWQLNKGDIFLVDCKEGLSPSTNSEMEKLNGYWLKVMHEYDLTPFGGPYQCDFFPLEDSSCFDIMELQKFKRIAQRWAWNSQHMRKVKREGVVIYFNGHAEQPIALMQKSGELPDI